MLLKLIPPRKTQQIKVIAEQKQTVLTTIQTKVIHHQTEAIIRGAEINLQEGIETLVEVGVEV